MRRILVPDAGGYSSKLKAVYLDELCKQAYGEEDQPAFRPTDDNPKLDVVQEYHALGLVAAPAWTMYDEVLPVSTATRMRKYDQFQHTDPLILSLFDSKRTLSDLAGGHEIPYMTSAHYNAVFRGNAIVKPAEGSGGKGIQVMTNASPGQLADGLVIQALSDDDREYVQDLYIFPATDGSGFFDYNHFCRQSLKRVEGRDTEVAALPYDSEANKAMFAFAEFLVERLHKMGLHDSLWCNVQYRWYNGLLRVMEIDSRISGSAQVHPRFGKTLLRSLGWKTGMHSPDQWATMSKIARFEAYKRIGLDVTIQGFGQ